MTTPDGPRLRVGHAERDRAVEVLRDAAAEGRLTFDELDGRIEEALRAKTREDLRGVLLDLLPPADLAALLSPGAVAAVGLRPGMSWQDPLVLTARWDDVKRAGSWEVPPFLEINAVAGNVKLDFRDARLLSQLIDINIVGGAGDIVLIVDQGWGVNVDRAQSTIGSVKSQVSPQPAPGMPLIVLRGRVSMGDVKVRHANRLDNWQRERRLARGGGPELKN